MQSVDESDLHEFEKFEEECLSLDGLQLVEYAIMLKESGCILELDDGGHRRALLAVLRRLEGLCVQQRSAGLTPLTVGRCCEQLRAADQGRRRLLPLGPDR